MPDTTRFPRHQQNPTPVATNGHKDLVNKAHRTIKLHFDSTLNINHRHFTYITQRPVIDIPLNSLSIYGMRWCIALWLKCHNQISVLGSPLYSICIVINNMLLLFFLQVKPAQIHDVKVALRSRLVEDTVATRWHTSGVTSKATSSSRPKASTTTLNQRARTRQIQSVLTEKAVRLCTADVQRDPCLTANLATLPLRCSDLISLQICHL